MTTVNTWVSRGLRVLVLLHAALLLTLALFQREVLTSRRSLKGQVWIMCFLGLLLFVELVTPALHVRKNAKVLDTILVFLWLILLVAGVTIAVGMGAV